jgi:hypothetical protein
LCERIKISFEENFFVLQVRLNMQRFVRKQKQTCSLLTLFSFTARFEGWRRYHVEA